MFWRFLVSVLVFTAATPAMAWWEYGHETVAKIAMQRVQPATRARIDSLLQQSRKLETPTCPARTIEQASIWPDCVKSLKERFSYAFSWHYQNVDICKPFDLSIPCKDGNCVSAQITRNAKLLGDTNLPVRERLMALAFLTHFVGDLHMPLHAGDRGDLGGNKQAATYGVVAGARLNLHAIWDGYLAERAISTPPALITEARADMAAGTVADWSRESWGVAHDSAYGVALGDPCMKAPGRAVLDNAKIASLVPVVRLQIVRGGVRLARLLDEALSPTASPTRRARD